MKRKNNSQEAKDILDVREMLNLKMDSQRQLDLYSLVKAGFLEAGQKLYYAKDKSKVCSIPMNLEIIQETNLVRDENSGTFKPYEQFVIDSSDSDNYVNSTPDAFLCDEDGDSLYRIWLSYWLGLT